MLIKLKSDFSDYPDTAFDSYGYEFRRMMGDGPNRKEMFMIFRGAELRTPSWGTIRELKELGLKDKLIVLHTDLNKHCGQSKVLVNIDDVKNGNLSKFAVEYIKPDLINTPLFVHKSKSTRYLFVGNRCVSYEYFSDDWRSNCGNVIITNLKQVSPLPKYRHNIHYPLFAIDFVGDQEPKAIDLNVAPGVSGFGLEKIIPPTQFVLLIKDWYKKYFNG